MARRRKKSKAAAAAKSREKDHSPMITEKSLPALPPNAIPPNAFSNDRVDPDSDTATELSPRPRIPHGRTESSSRSSSRPARSPERKPEGLGLPASTYRSNRNSTIIPRTDNTGDDPNSFFIQVALDPSPGPTPRSTSENLSEVGKTKEKDYFTIPKAEKRSDSQHSTPHIAFQEKPRQPSTNSEVEAPPKLPARKLSKSSRTDTRNQSPAVEDKLPQKSASRAQPPSEDFKLQDAPKSKKAITSRSSSQSSGLPQDSSATRISNGSTRNAREVLGNLPNADTTETNTSSRTSQDSRAHDEEDIRASIDTSSKPASIRTDSSKPIARKEVPPTSATRNGMFSNVISEIITLLTKHFSERKVKAGEPSWTV